METSSVEGIWNNFSDEDIHHLFNCLADGGRTRSDSVNTSTTLTDDDLDRYGFPCRACYSWKQLKADAVLDSLMTCHRTQSSFGLRIWLAGSKRWRAKPARQYQKRHHGIPSRVKIAHSMTKCITSL